MTATLALQPKPKTEQAPESVAAPTVETVDAVDETSIARSIAIVLPTTMLVVFLGVIAAFVIGGTPVGEAVGYGAYLSFWIGGGFGAILSGSIWSQKAGGH